jgi:hypothetical protein
MPRVAASEIQYARSGGAVIAYQVVGEGDTHLVYVPDFMSVKDLVAGSGLVFAGHGMHDLKGMPGTWPLYAVA